MVVCKVVCKVPCTKKLLNNSAQQSIRSQAAVRVKVENRWTKLFLYSGETTLKKLYAKLHDLFHRSMCWIVCMALASSNFYDVKVTVFHFREKCKIVDSCTIFNLLLQLSLSPTADMETRTFMKPTFTFFSFHFPFRLYRNLCLWIYIVSNSDGILL